MPKSNILVSASSARLAHIADSSFITVYKETLLAELVACFGPNRTVGRKDQNSNTMNSSSDSWHGNI